MMKKTPLLSILICSLLLFMNLTACAGTSASATPATEQTAESSVTETSPAATELPPTLEVKEISETPTDEATGSGSWRDLPIIPEVSPAMVEVFQRGLSEGRNPNRFSKIGDCQNITTYFLAMFDGGTYRLGDKYAYLQPTIDFFAGSWSRKSMAVKGGLNIVAVQNSMWTDAVEKYTKQDWCKNGETPLACELRDYNPSFALISMEESWTGSYDIYETGLRSIVEYVLSLDIVPILATRTENLDQDRQINDIVVKIAQEYQLPLWNFGAAVTNLPNAGFRDNDKFHLTEGKPLFDDPEEMTKGWPWRNLTALQTLDAVSKGVGAQK